MFRVPTFPYDTATRDAPTHRQQPFRSPKVVSIPVHFVDSETTTRSTMPRSKTAVKIQKVWRGFLARKNVNKILGIKREVDAIEKKISDKETAGDAKERLKLNEMLMALLFRLDSIRGLDLGIRDCRKRVINKAIMLQERVDAISSGETQDHQDSAVDGSEDQKLLECCNTGQENLISVQEVEEELTGEGEGEQDQNSELEEEEEGCCLLVKEEDDCEEKNGETKVEQQSKAVGDEEKNSSQGLMEKMIEPNEILIGLVNDLCEKNKLQTQMINCLTKKVDSLEKSFRSERSKCKRRKQDAKRTRSKVESDCI